MSTVPFIPDNAPFNAEQRAWLNGFLAGHVFLRAAGYGCPSRAAQACFAALQPSTSDRRAARRSGLAKKLVKGAEGSRGTPRSLALAGKDDSLPILQTRATRCFSSAHTARATRRRAAITFRDALFGGSACLNSRRCATAVFALGDHALRAFLQVRYQIWMSGCRRWAQHALSLAWSRTSRWTRPSTQWVRRTLRPHLDGISRLSRMWLSRRTTPAMCPP